MAVKTWSKIGHNWMPNGLSTLGSGSDLKISEVLDDILTGQLRQYPSAKVVGTLRLKYGRVRSFRKEDRSDTTKKGLAVTTRCAINDEADNPQNN